MLQHTVVCQFNQSITEQICSGGRNLQKQMSSGSRFGQLHTVRLGTAWHTALEDNMQESKTTINEQEQSQH